LLQRDGVPTPSGAPTEGPAGGDSAEPWSDRMLDSTLDKSTARQPKDAHPPPPSDFRRLLEALPAAAYTCDREGLITYFNERARELWGRAPALNSASDRYCGSFRLFASDGTPIPPEGCWMALTLETGKEQNSREFLIERTDGTRLTVLANINPLRDADGRVVGAVNILIDISDRRRMEEALQAAYAERDAQQKRKDEFLAVLAHELRNPLAPIGNAVQVLHTPGAQDTDRQWAAAVIDRQVRHMARLVDDLLDLQRITRGKLDLRKGLIDLRDIVAAALEASRPLIESRSQQLVLELTPEPIRLDGDLTRLAQVLADLLDNAAKFTPHGGSIAVRTERHAEEALIRVRDTGIGIAPEQLSCIFQMFARSQPATEHADGGLGVGLTLAKRLVELHGGAISAHSDGIGRGSEFVVRLPARQAELAQTQPVAASHARDAPSGLRIVIVDDNRDSAESLQLMLELMGNEVRTGHDGAEAVELVEAFHPHAVLLDIGLPVISGYEAAKRIRALAGSANCMLVAITGWGQDSDRERSREAGFDHHLVKPVDAAQLLGILGTAQPRARAARPSAKKKHRHPHMAEQPRGEARRPASAPKRLSTGKAR